MNLHQIQDQLIDQHERFTQIILALNKDEFLFAPPGKWTAGEQLDHIYRSVSALSLGLSLPKFLIRLYVGKANRPSKTYDELVAKYKLKLSAGGKARGRFVPKSVNPGSKEITARKLKNAVRGLCKKIGRYTEEQLDYYILPHPLLGKLTLREMLYFTIYHVQHHHQLTVQNLGLMA